MKKLYKKPMLSVLFLVMTVSHCDGKKDNDPDRSPAEDSQVLVPTVAIGTVESNAALSVDANGQSSHVLDARALKDAFEPVFGDKARSTPTAYFKANPNEYFTRQEKVALGTFNYESSEVQIQFYGNLRVPTLTYLQAVRGFLVDACKVLVNREYPALGSDGAGNNKLIRSKNPSAGDVSKFMTLVFGYPSSGLHRGAEDFVALFVKQKAEQMSAPNSNEDNVLKNLYVLMCVAIGSDSRAIMR